jgi:hypothetical protein
LDQGQLHELVSEFRASIKSLAESGHWFEVSINNDFPSGACDDSSQLLAAYLTDQGYPGALRVSGSSGGNNQELCTHVWLSLEGLLIDITGSQFENYEQPAILIAEKDDFLSTFKVEEECRLADFREEPLLPQYAFNEAYEAILRELSRLK